MNRMSKKKNKDIQIQNPDITSKDLVMNLDFFSSKNIGTVFNKTKKRLIKANMNHLIRRTIRTGTIRKNSNIAINGVDINTLLVLKLIKKPLILIFKKSFIKLS